MATEISNGLPTDEEWLEYYRANPSDFVEDQLGMRCWSGMRAVIDSAFEHKRTSVRACHGISKTLTAACVGITFLTLYPPSIVLTTAPTNRQVQGLLWKEIRRIYNEAPGDLPGICLTRQVKIWPDWFMYGFATEHATNLEGYHAENIMWILDEAKGLEQWLYDAVEGSLTGENARIMEISTTDGADQTCPFRKHHVQRKGWNVFSFSAWDSPFVDPDDYPDEAKPNQLLIDYGKPRHGSEWPTNLTAEIPIVDTKWIEDRRDAWKDADPYMWQTKVRGEFSDVGGDSIIPIEWIESAINAKVSLDGDPCWGLDVARMGNDKCCLCEKQGGRLHIVETWGKVNTMVTSGKVRLLVPSDGLVKVDMIGVGAGVFDRLAELGQPTIGVNSAESPIIDENATDKDERTYVNLRAQMWFHARDVFEMQFKRGGVISIDDDEELVEDLAGMNYKARSDGKLLAASKDDFRKKFGRSPDKGDSAIYALFDFPVVQDDLNWA